MGEWDAPHLIPNDKEIMPFVDMCNIACGAHAGSNEIMALTIELAIKNKVKIGAHPGFEDRKNFGRTYISLSAEKLAHSLLKQLKKFLAVCTDLNVQPFHIKAHGALYHACNQLDKEANAFIKIVKDLCPHLIILVAPDSHLEKKARNEGLVTMSESFIDRKYNNDLSLVSRLESNAVISDVCVAKNQYKMLSKGEIITKNGVLKTLVSTTACIHGDNPKCLEILRAIRSNE